MKRRQKYHSSILEGYTRLNIPVYDAESFLTGDSRSASREIPRLLSKPKFVTVFTGASRKVSRCVIFHTAHLCHPLYAPAHFFFKKSCNLRSSLKIRGHDSLPYKNNCQNSCFVYLDLIVNLFECRRDDV
jgi:hypothetical protein